MSELEISGFVFSNCPPRCPDDCRGNLRAAPDPVCRMEVDTGGLSSVDFRYSERTMIQFPRQELRVLSKGTTTEFDWKDYCPTVFRHIQALDNIDFDDYMLSICCHGVLLEVSSSLNPGSLHYLPHDDRFVIKTLKKSELKVLLEMLPNYCRHVRKYRSSLLTKFYGLHYIKGNRGLKVYFAVMSNMLKSDEYVHLWYDLKGSPQGRSLNKLEFDQKTVLKDQDLEFCFYLDPLIRVRLLAQIKYDCQFLEDEGIMDYSLLLGIHLETSHQGLGNAKQADADMTSEDLMGSRENIELTMSDICDPEIRSDFKFGAKIPAEAVRSPRESNRGSVAVTWSIKTRERYNVILFLGVIDILQDYGVTKRIEHVYKSLQFDSKSISAVNPKVYSSRFQQFISTIFQENESKS